LRFASTTGQEFISFMALGKTKGGAETVMVFVRVIKGNIPAAMRELKKKLEREGQTREMKKRQYFIKPSEARRTKHDRHLKMVKKRARLESE